MSSVMPFCAVKKPMHFTTLLCSIPSVCEKEANLFAAEYLMDDDEVLEALNRDGTFFNAASQLMVPAELLDFKFRMLKWKGYQMMESPIAARSNFLRDLSIPVNTDYESC